MDIEKILSEITNQTGVRLSSNDPIVTTVLLNKMILNEYVSDLGKKLNESITNVAVKENITLDKLKNILLDQQLGQNKETEKIYNQFIDNLNQRLLAIQRQPVGSDIQGSFIFWKYASVFLLGLLAGGLIVFYFV